MLVFVNNLRKNKDFVLNFEIKDGNMFRIERILQMWFD